MSSQTRNIEKNKTVLITGASGKIGLKLVKIFSDLGFDVIAHYNTNEDISVRAGLKPVPTFTNRITAIKANFPAQLPEIYEIIDKHKENLCCLVNCAAIFEKGNLKDTDNLQKTMQINGFTPLILSQKYAEIVKKGNIINILDGNIYRFNENYQNYRVSKRFLEETTKESALIFAPQIRVNAVAFGMLEEKANPSNTVAKNKEVLKNEISDKNISRSIEFLLFCENLTGQIIYLDNGVHLV
ncbi:MAG: SDR family oxidoreductase [Chitinivibrionia bacterium]|nr:SDR family oxidoreductase [Chitinivibrionia bacterium]